MPRQFTRDDVQRHLQVFDEDVIANMRPWCSMRLHWEYIQEHIDDPAFLDAIMASAVDFDPAEYLSGAPPDEAFYIFVCGQAEAIAGDILLPDEPLS